MVLRVVLRVTSQCSQLLRCSLRSARMSTAASSIMSSSSERNSVQVICLPLPSVGSGRCCRGTSGFAFEVAAETLAQLKTGAQQARFDGRNAEAERFGSVLGREPLDVAQLENHAEARGQSLDGLFQDLLELGLGVVLLRVGSPVGQVAGDAAILGGHILVDRDHFASAPLAEAHQGFVDCDSDQPCVELRVPLKLVKLFVGLEERVLHHVFSVFAILRNVLRNAKNLAIVLADELVISRQIPAANPFDQGYVGMLLVLCYGLDGRHARWLRNSAPRWSA